MSRASANANAVVYGIVETCALYGVETFRMQSRVFTVPGAAGRDRPLFIGQWTDQFGKMHNRGMSDILARPKVPLKYLEPVCWVKVAGSFGLVPTIEARERFEYGAAGLDATITLPLWIEAKSGRGGLTDDQVAFKSYVESNGETWLLIHDDLRPLIEWLEIHGVKK